VELGLMPEKRGRGRPKKVGKWKYYIKTGAIWGNLGMTQPAWNAKLIVKDTDTECKRAAQKFFESFQSSKHQAVMSLEERGKLTELIMDLDNLREAQAAWEVDSFEGGPLFYSWTCQWGEQGEFTACLEITRAKADQADQQKGML
jgi:hypothetical protein